MQDIKINKEIRDYKEQIFLGIFDMRQTICIFIGGFLCVILYQFIPMPHSIYKILLSGIPMIPLAIIGFYSYNKMPGEELLLRCIDFYIRKPRRYTCTPSNDFYDLKASDIEKLQMLSLSESKDTSSKTEET